MRLQEIETTASYPVNLHIDVYSAQTGISRFTQLYDDADDAKVQGQWSYNKTEDLSMTELANFTHLLVGNIEENHDLIKELSNTHDILDEVQAFKGLSDISVKTFPPFKLSFSTAVYIFRKKGLH